MKARILALLVACAEDKVSPGLRDSVGAETEADTADTGELWDEACAPVVSALEADLEAAGATGGAVAIWADGGLLCAFGAGRRGPEDDAPVGADTLFRAGPLTSTLTAVALMARMAEEPEGLDTPVTAVLPELRFTLDASWAGSITIRHALQRTTGMVDVPEISANPADEVLSGYLLEVYPATRWLMSEPGELWNLSSPGDGLAGLLVEYGAGVRYRQAMRLYLFDRLGMDSTVFLAEDVLEHGDFASSQSLDWTGESEDLRAVDPTSYDNGWARPSAYAWTDAEDLGRLLGFLLEGDSVLLADEDRERMWTETVDTHTCGDPAYGYGLYVQEGLTLGDARLSGTFVSQEGGLPGYSAALLASPDDGVGVAILVNADDAELSPTLLAALELGGLSAEPADEAEDESPTLEGLAGSYLDPWSYGVLEFSVEDEILSVSIPLLDTWETPYDAELERRCGDTFTLSIDGQALELTFLRNEEGGEAARVRASTFVADREG